MRGAVHICTCEIVPPAPVSLPIEVIPVSCGRLAVLKCTLRMRISPLAFATRHVGLPFAPLLLVALGGAYGSAFRPTFACRPWDAIHVYRCHHPSRHVAA